MGGLPNRQRRGIGDPQWQKGWGVGDDLIQIVFIFFLGAVVTCVFACNP